MKRKILFLFWVLILTACGQPSFEPKYSVSVGAEFVQSFKDAAKTNNRSLASVQDNLILVQGTLPVNELGVCRIRDGQNTIIVNAQDWAYLGRLEQEELIWHELGHCWLHRGHNNAYLPHGEPASIMNAYHFGADVYWQNYGYYVSELFGN